MKLHQLSPARGATKARKRIGRGPGSGHGKTATKGHKGLLARSGGGKQPGFEGGQMPLLRRMPKFGFRNPSRVEYAIVNLKSLALLQTAETVTPGKMVEAGLITKKTWPVKVLGSGELTRPLVIQAHKFSKSAEEKIKAVGGRAEVIRGV